MAWQIIHEKRIHAYNRCENMYKKDKRYMHTDVRICIKWIMDTCVLLYILYIAFTEFFRICYIWKKDSNNYIYIYGMIDVRISELEHPKIIYIWHMQWNRNRVVEPQWEGQSICLEAQIPGLISNSNSMGIFFLFGVVGVVGGRIGSGQSNKHEVYCVGKHRS